MTEFVRDVALTDDAIRGLELLASSLDWPCYVVELGKCIDKTQLLEQCAGVLRFPSWFGQNWDAFFDCLIDLASVRRARGCVIVLRHAAELRAASPEAFDTARSILADAAKVWSDRGVAMRVFVETA
ncbi:MAG: barstar family protein [Steroidobacteraceae bacterium]|jgi:RNAse (barnase) inhibitor barstar